MIVRTQSGGILKPPEDRKVDSVIICLDNGTPIAVAVDIDGRAWLYTANEKEFASTMEVLGFNKRDLPSIQTVNI